MAIFRNPLRRNYVKRRNSRRKSFVRLRGRLWFQIVYYSITTIVVTYLSTAVGNIVRLLVKLCQNAMQSYIDYKTGISSVDWTKFLFDSLNSFLPENLFRNVIQAQPWVITNSGKNYTIYYVQITWLIVLSLAIFNFVIKRWYNWYTLYGNRIRNSNHFANFYEIDSAFSMIPDRNKIYDGKPGQQVAHISGYNLRMLAMHPIIWLTQVLKLVLGLNSEVFPFWYRKIRPSLVKTFPKLYANQENVEGGFHGFYWVDTEITHVKTTGATRSGKDQMRGYPLIDINRRSTQPWNIVDTDAKNEDYKMSYIPLRKAGFDVHAINIMNVDESETFNPLQMALDYAMDGDLDQAQIEVAKVVQIIGSDANNQGGGDIWDKTAESTQQAVILILLKLAIDNNDPSLVTPAGVPQFINSLSQFTDDDEDGLTKYLKMLQKLPMTPMINEIIGTAGAYLGSSGDTKTSVMFTLQARTRLFASESIARLTSSNSINVMDMAYPRMIKVLLNSQYSGLTGIIRLYDSQNAKDEQDFIEEDKVRITRSGLFQFPFKAKFPNNWAINITFNDTNNPHHIRGNIITVVGHKEQERAYGKVIVDEYSKKPIIKSVVDSIDSKLIPGAKAEVSLRYSEKPKAVFIITPQDNDNYAAIATLYISQVYAVTTSIASNITRRKLTTPIFYKLNEFSMFPKIPGFNNLLTRGLTYGHMVEIYLQSLSQLELKYTKEEVKEISDNTLTWNHILTPNAETNTEFSKALGEIEVMEESVNSQVGLDHQDRGNRQMNKVKVPLLDPVEVQYLSNNESLTLPLAKRLDKKFRKIQAVPIFATGPYKLPNARDLLKKEYSLKYYTTDLGIRSKTAGIKYEELFADFAPYYLELEREVGSTNDEETPTPKVTVSATDVEEAIDEITSQQGREVVKIDEEVQAFKLDSRKAFLAENSDSKTVQLASKALIEAAQLTEVSTDSDVWQKVFSGRYFLDNPNRRTLQNELKLSWKALWAVTQVINGEINQTQLTGILDEDVEEDPDEY
ncbi:type IV secretory pathway, VirD4 protein [Weissella oryzae SG25]|uniref:Type IV secretory pathway, VirD4 protein n=1 Tax=Weissella oryzae (strain DSM 25784 / JCM 18191 / LMG 30913 / SG25) TaxID=1329250 RepID=A0A069CVP1_WEIOS|nr:type IV secretory system conjugative DNA transfer family protein [Weissella oryzae]GAK31554.1 type IV secretory pathway, VirD4 protein [Weissella oryzae SG25]